MDELIETVGGWVKLRTTRASDGERLRDLRVEALTGHPTAFSSSPEEAMAEDWVLRATEGCGDGLAAIFVAETEEELVGMAGIFASAKPKFPHSAFIWGVYTRPAW